MFAELTQETAIAHRTLELSENSAEKVNVLIGKPEQLGENEWACPYRIVGAGKDINFRISGVDSIQALQLVFSIIESAIIGANLSLCWNGEKNLGLSRYPHKL
ncbi:MULTISPECIES: hypothetical protein [unclassified Neisseria]|uniref:DUF6968 family protein n=1 Tax=unclassified Neisseria TaxID=2623750 RepID=UPI0026656354|nr:MULTISPECIES: hypothetical protein [unclassified Neisseria]MDO1509687.1 hypothetical protein [Neisseria sp. MVDL19-042950]MDO1515989.1 hypothetical protein [Neisseria sp. MVDL18-041461]MDO1563102.1 hypothetical protein [Neisseria sp. MVDL20-010259]